MFGWRVHSYLGELLLHPELIELHAVAHIGDEGCGVDLLYFAAVALQVELAHQSVSPFVDEVDELGLPAGQDGLVVYHAQ